MEYNISPKLAEICGVHAGDGYLRGGSRRWELDISGNIEEKDYYDFHLKQLFEDFFKIKINCRFFPSRNTYGFVIRDRNVIKLMHDLGFPYGNKTLSLQVPKVILESSNKEVFSKFLRGVFDTDGCVYFRTKKGAGKYSEFKQNHNYYPVVIFTTVSQIFSLQLKEMLKKLDFQKISEYIYHPKGKNEHDRYTLTLHGISAVNKFFNEVGSKNHLKLSRYLLWKKIGHCPSNLTYLQRMQMLKSTNN